MYNTLNYSQTDIDRFFRNIKPPDNDIEDCWLWSGYLDKDRYGELYIDSKNIKHIRSHRFSWEYFIGQIPVDKQILHKCDNPPCVNPNHLFIGTQQDNKNDEISKKRHAFGQKQGASILTDNDVKKIIEETLIRKHISIFDIANAYNVHHSTINNIIQEYRWTHVTKQFSKQEMSLVRQILHHKRGSKLDNSTILQIKTLKTQGYTNKYISNLFGISNWSVDKYK